MLKLRRDIRMAAIMLQTIPSFYKKVSEKKSLCFCKNIHYLERLLHRPSRQQDFFLPACKYHIILLGNVEDILKKLDTFCFTYQHVDCLYTLFKYRFSAKVIVKSGQVFDNVQRAVDFNHRNNGVDRKPSIAKKRFLRKKYKCHLFSSFPKTKTTKTSGSMSAEGI